MPSQRADWGVMQEEARQEDIEAYKRLARALGRIWGGQRKERVKVTCAVCKKPIESTLREGKPYRRYCSPACSNKAYRERHHDDVLKRKREAYRRRKAQGPGQASS